MSVKELTAQPISDHKPYTPGKQPISLERTIKLNTNENPYPPSPQIAESILSQINDLNRYPDSSAEVL